MCGIVGYQGENHRQQTRRGLALIRHRGPDETVTKTFPLAGFSFGINRLAIRDLHKGLYPFSYQRYHLVYNGEIYNVRALVKKAHHAPKTGCDAELILPMFARYGVHAFDDFVGMFALAIYDASTNRLVLARDKFGEKPLYYQVTKSGIAFSSELKVFAVASSVSSESVLLYLAFGYQPFRSTIYTGVEKVLPGEAVTIDLETRQVRRQFYTKDPQRTKVQQPLGSIDRTQSVQLLDQTLQTIVEEKVVADVPVGVYLSGGVDSSLLAALVARLTRKKVKTFSVAFDSERYDESSASRNVARYLKTDHTEIPVSAKRMQAIWDSVIRALDEPFADPAIFPTYLLSQEAKKYVTVIMSGEGADEFFGGYPHYRKHLLTRGLPSLPRRLMRKLLRLVPSQRIARTIGYPEALYTSARYNTLWNAGGQLRDQYIKLVGQTWDELGEMKRTRSAPLPLNLFLYDLHYYVGEQLCMKVDKMTMLHSLESRAPYLDERLYPFMAMSARLLRWGYQDKYLLRQVAKHHIPHEIANREKHGFSLPLEYWLRSGLRDKVEHARNPHAMIRSILTQKTVRDLIDGFLSGRHNDDLAVWNVVILDSWLKEHTRQ